MQNNLTEEEKQWMMSMLMREQSSPQQKTVQSVSSGSGGGGGGGGGQAIPPPQQMQQQQQQAMEIRGNDGGGGGMPGMNKLGEAIGNKLGEAIGENLGGSAIPASGAGSALTATEAAAFTPAYAPQSLAIGGSTANAGVGTALPGNVGAAPAAGGIEAGAGSFALPALAMAALVKGGNELDIGAADQMDFYQDILPDNMELNSDAGRKLLKFWEWF